jgi:serine/threonine protein kinase
MVVFGRAVGVIIVSGRGTDHERQVSANIGGNLRDTILLQPRDRPKVGDEVECSLFDEPRVITRVDPETTLDGRVSMWHATIVPKSEWEERRRPSGSGKNVPRQAAMSRPNQSLVFETTFTTYTAQKQLGQGGTGTVYQATDESGRVVAIKLLDVARAASRDGLKRFQNELMFGLRNQHPNVITISDHGRFRRGDSSAPFYVMPVYAESLRSLITVGLKPHDVLSLFAQCLDGVESAHLQDIIHRDMKPENVLYDERSQRLVVADFGIAEFAQEELYTLVETKPTTRLANFQYAAPEQRERGGACDRRTDVFALGLMLNEMFTGVVPHGTDYPTIASIAPEFAYLDDLVSWMLRRKPSDRPDSIGAIKNELIGRRNVFVEHQQLSRLKQTVIPASEDR